MYSLHTDVEQFQSEFNTKQAEGKPVLLYFFATWAGPCKLLTPTLQIIAREQENTLHIMAIDIDECDAIASQYSIQATPTIILTLNGKIKETISGASEAKIREVIANEVN